MAGTDSWSRSAQESNSVELSDSHKIKPSSELDFSSSMAFSRSFETFKQSNGFSVSFRFISTQQISATQANPQTAGHSGSNPFSTSIPNPLGLSNSFTPSIVWSNSLPFSSTSSLLVALSSVAQVTTPVLIVSNVTPATKCSGLSTITLNDFVASSTSSLDSRSLSTEVILKTESATVHTVSPIDVSHALTHGTSAFIGEETNAAKDSESSDETIWLVISIVAMAVFVTLFSYLIYKEKDVKQKSDLKGEKTTEASQEKKKGGLGKN
jgi:hypothetical protein